MTIDRRIRLAAISFAGVVLAACGGSDGDELQGWMTEQRNMTRPKIAPISEPKVFKPESYALAGTIEPFSREKLTQALRSESSQTGGNGALVAPELARRRRRLKLFRWIPCRWLEA